LSIVLSLTNFILKKVVIRWFFLILPTSPLPEKHLLNRFWSHDSPLNSVSVVFGFILTQAFSK
jgi:hypothetical protein